MFHVQEMVVSSHLFSHLLSGSSQPIHILYSTQEPRKVNSFYLWKHTWRSQETCNTWISTLRQLGSCHEKTSLGMGKRQL